MIKNKNLRLTALNEFWSKEYDSDIYLWEGAKNNLNLNDIKTLNVSTYTDIFASHDSAIKAMTECKDYYFKYLDILTEKLNHIHNQNFSSHFWQISFGYWLYRHISITYEKYAYLSEIDIDNIGVVLLDKESYYTPTNQYDYLRCFCNDFGVQQLVSEYFDMSGLRKHPTLKKEYSGENNSQVEYNINSQKSFSIGGILRGIRKIVISKMFKILPAIIKPKIVLLSTNYSRFYLKKLYNKSFGRIQVINIPEVILSQKNINLNKREKLSEYNGENGFERYLNKTFQHCFPRIYVEDFMDYYRDYYDNIQKQSFNSVITEGWVGIDTVSVYCAISESCGKEVIIQEHSALRKLASNSTLWIDLSLRNSFISTGWLSEDKNVVQGGFMKNPINKRSIIKEKSKILYVGQTLFPYIMEFSSNASNSSFFKALMSTSEFFKGLPKELCKNLYFRPRIAKFYLNTEFALDFEDNIKIDKENFLESIISSEIIVIDHITAGLAEILTNNIPFIVIINEYTIISEEYNSIIDSLHSCGVAHFSTDKAIQHLTSIFSDIQGWWEKELVQTALQEFKSIFLATPSNTIDFVLSNLD